MHPYSLARVERYKVFFPILHDRISFRHYVSRFIYDRRQSSSVSCD